ncbi:MgtC/SapB family protein [Sciscionella marina]|uniref:MgtC/SapB family protein n=1 Tax=Sciscionella marina TaxID=508770 RepID=UPI000360C4E8|nr:MgtC/SapB family protein [Sciscionella marina]
MTLFEPTGQGWTQILELLIALVLCSLIGLERQIKQKSAGLRTHTLVGLGSALFVLFSKYGFADVLAEGRVVLDPSRVAAQIVSGIGFIGGGLIFVRRDVVRGLTTAAVVWVSAAVGCASAAGLPLLAAVVTGAHFLVVYGYPPMVRILMKARPSSTVVRVRYADSRGVLRVVLGIATGAGFTIGDLSTRRDEDPLTGGVDVRIRVTGTTPVHELVSSLSEVDGVYSVRTEDDDADEEEEETD